MLIAATGAVIGDNIGFAVGHHFGRRFILKVGRFVFLTPKRFEHMENYFKSHGNKTILVARFITGLRVFAALLAGASNMRWRIFLAYNLAGAVIWSVVITTLGYVFGQSLPLLVEWVGRSGTVLLIVGDHRGVHRMAILPRGKRRDIGMAAIPTRNAAILFRPLALNPNLYFPFAFAIGRATAYISFAMRSPRPF